MSSRGEIVGAVDFGSHAVRVLIARRDPEGAIRVIGHGAASGRGCVSQGVIQDLSAAQTAFGRALGDAEQAAHVHVRTLFCGINGRSVETSIQEGRVKLEDGIVEPRHLKAALDQASRTILAADKQITSSVKAQEWFVDDQRVINPVGIRGQVLKIREHFACLPAVIADNLDGCVQAQGREIENFIFLPLASALGCLTPEDMELGIAVLDIGHSTTGLALYRDHSVIDTCCFNLGGTTLHATSSRACRSRSRRPNNSCASTVSPNTESGRAASPRRPTMPRPTHRSSCARRFEARPTSSRGASSTISSIGEPAKY